MVPEFPFASSFHARPVIRSAHANTCRDQKLISLRVAPRIALRRHFDGRTWARACSLQERPSYHAAFRNRYRPAEFIAPPLAESSIRVMTSRGTTCPANETLHGTTPTRVSSGNRVYPDKKGLASFPFQRWKRKISENFKISKLSRIVIRSVEG